MIPKAYQNAQKMQQAHSITQTKRVERPMSYYIALLIIFFASFVMAVHGYKVLKNIGSLDMGYILKKIPFRIGFGSKVNAASSAEKTQAVGPASDKKEDPKKEEPTAATSTAVSFTEKIDPDTFDPMAIASDDEVKLLKSLSQRRAELVKREQDVKQKEATLLAIKKEIDENLKKISQQKNDMEKMLKKTTQEDEEKLMQLVKYYEGMKPKDAGRVMNKLDIKILRDIVTRMNKKKVSEVFANMDEKVVRDITVLLAHQKNPYNPTQESSNKNTPDNKAVKA